MNLLTTAEDVLDEAGYRTFKQYTDAERFFFEDESIFGVVTTYPTLEELLDEWKARQDAFLKDQAPSLRASENKEKVWNAYSVHLTVGGFAPDGERATKQKNRLFRIEEEFRGTRKIARAALDPFPDEVQTALFSLLPLQENPELGAEHYREDLRSELRSNFDDAFLRVLDEEIKAKYIVQELVDESTSKA